MLVKMFRLKHSIFIISNARDATLWVAVLVSEVHHFGRVKFRLGYIQIPKNY